MRLPLRRDSELPSSFSCKSQRNLYAGLVTSDPLAALIEAERDVGGLILSIVYALPSAMCTAEHGMCVTAAKECSVRRKRKEILPHASWTTRRNFPRTHETLTGLGCGFLAASRRASRYATGHHQAKQTQHDEICLPHFLSMYFLACDFVHFIDGEFSSIRSLTLAVSNRRPANASRRSALPQS
jgi:hypothetical protein